jgi:alpha-galactosidase
LSKRRAACLCLVLLACTPLSHAHKAPLEPTGHWDGVTTGSAATPPMGWNSWNAFGTGITEEKLLNQATRIKDLGLAQRGYTYINIDDGWWLKRRLSDGQMQVRTNLFPSAAVGGAEETSFKPFTDKLHALGLKAGIYTDIGRNACSQAWSPENPNLPQGTQAEREVGLYGHVAQDMRLYFQRWNFDYIKVDGCGIAHYAATRPQVANGHFRAFPPLMVDANANRSNIPAIKSLYTEMRTALAHARPSHDYVLSLCNWGAANVRAWGQDVGTSWRTSNDIDPSWGRMLHNFDSVSTRELYSGPGHWNDPDMLEVGNGGFDAAHMTEAQAHMSLWAMVDAPLLIGTDLTHAPQAIVDVLGAPEVLAVNQDAAGNQATMAYNDSERQILVKQLSVRGRKAVLLFNRTDSATEVTLTPAHLKMQASAPIVLRDLWTRQDIGTLGTARVFPLAPHQALLLTAQGTAENPHAIYLSEMPARIHVAADGIKALENDPFIHRMIDPYNPSTTSSGNPPVYAGWGAPRADATPYNQGLSINGETFRSGLGTLANARLQVRLNGAYAHFSARVGVDDTTRGTHGRVRFEIYGDGRLLAQSAPLRFGASALPLDADTTHVHVLELVVRQLTPDVANVVATWGNAKLEF